MHPSGCIDYFVGNAHRDGSEWSAWMYQWDVYVPRLSHVIVFVRRTASMDRRRDDNMMD
jgi:hypothetical protein